MTTLDRQAVIDLLGRLGDASDEEALKAARELHRLIGESGLTWGEILRTGLAAGSDEPAAEEEPAAGEAAAEPDGDVSDADKNEAAKLIDRLLTRKTISDTLRDDLVAIKRSIAEGTFDAMDRRYLRALVKRLGA